MSKRFDYVAFTMDNKAFHDALRALFEDIEQRITEMGPTRTTSLALTKLEESYMWAGKALRDMQDMQEDVKKGPE